MVKPFDPGEKPPTPANGPRALPPLAAEVRQSLHALRQLAEKDPIPFKGMPCTIVARFSDRVTRPTDEMSVQTLVLPGLCAVTLTIERHLTCVDWPENTEVRHVVFAPSSGTKQPPQALVEQMLPDLGWRGGVLAARHIGMGTRSDGRCFLSIMQAASEPETAEPAQAALYVPTSLSA